MFHNAWQHLKCFFLFFRKLMISFLEFSLTRILIINRFLVQFFTFTWEMRRYSSAKNVTFNSSAFLMGNNWSTIIGTTTPGQNELGSNSDEVILHTLSIFRLNFRYKLESCLNITFLSEENQLIATADNIVSIF